MHLRVDVWSDIACPWCWIGKRHLELAVAESRVRPEVVWRAFELDPSAPAASDPSVPYAARLARKYRVPVAEAQRMIDGMTERARGVGLEMRFDRVRPTNTFDAHRLLAWARERSAAAQDALKEALFQAYMRDGLLLGDAAVLADAAARAGLPRAEAEEVLGRGAFADEVRGDEGEAQGLGVTGVPFFVVTAGPTPEAGFAGRTGVAVSGAQPPAVLAQAITRVLEGARPPEVAGPACGPAGC